MAITREEAIALFNRVADAVNQQDAATILSFYADDAIVISPAFSEMHGKEAIAASWEKMFAAFPDWTVGSVDVMVDGDRMLAIAFNSFTDNNGWFGLPATGERVTYRNLLLLTKMLGEIDPALFEGFVQALPEAMRKAKEQGKEPPTLLSTLNKFRSKDLLRGIVVVNSLLEIWGRELFSAANSQSEK